MINTMSYKGYTASMVFDAQDRIIVGRVLDVDDLIAFHGASVAEFESRFQAAIDAYLAAAKELGSEPEKPASGKVMLRIAPEVHAAAIKAAARSGTSLNKWAEGALGKAARKVAALVLAITPGTGIAYVVARTVAAAFGLSVVVANSALAFSLVKYLGAASLVYLGIKLLLRQGSSQVFQGVAAQGARRQGAAAHAGVRRHHAGAGRLPGPGPARRLSHRARLPSSFHSPVFS